MSMSQTAAQGGEGAGADKANLASPVPSEDLQTAPFKRDIRFVAAFDKRNPDPSKNYGVHGAECVFTLSKAGKGVTFAIYTNWMLPHVQAETDARPIDHRFPFLSHKPQPAGVDYHDTRPHYEGHTLIENCRVTGGGCYSDGSGLLGEELFDVLVKGGSEALWTRMEELYADWIEDPALSQIPKETQK